MTPLKYVYPASLAAVYAAALLLELVSSASKVIILILKMDIYVLPALATASVAIL
jgi:multisubunit Na+/H+ antiporter MnhE subunit